MKEFTKEDIETLKDTSTPVVLKFYAEWCGPCRNFSPIMEMVANNTEGVNFFSVNVDEHNTFAQSLGISSIPATVVFEEGREVARFVGLKNAKEVSELLKNNLKSLNG